MKTVYQTNAEGYFTGPVQADPSPLEPEVWLIPGGAVEIEPPVLAEGQRARWNGAAWDVIDPEPEPEPAPEPTAEELLAAQRAGMIVSRFQARAALHMVGKLADIEALVAQADPLAQIAWADAQEFRRDSPTINALAAQVGMSDADLDNLFRAAAQITA